MNFPTTKELKLRARHFMAGAFGTCSVTALVLVLATYALSQALSNAGGSIALYFWDTASSQIASSLSLSADGLFLALRMEEAGMGVSVAVTPAGLLKLLLLQLVCAAVIAPLRLGCHERLWAVRRGGESSLLTLLAPYANPRRGLQTVLLEVVLTAVHLLLQLICAIPALLLLRATGPTMEGVSAVSWTLLLGMAAAWALMTPLIPARTLLARTDHATALSALKGSLALLRGVTGRYLRLRLSFAVAEVASILTRGIFDIYLFPMRTLATVAWLEAREEELEGAQCPS